MRRRFIIALNITASLFLLACGTTASSRQESHHPAPTFNPVHGPFNSNGDYIEAWADGRGRKSLPLRSPRTNNLPDLTRPKKVTQRSKPKPKSSVRYKVKKGDTLYWLARKNGTSVKKIQRANGISGSNIRIGQVLTIPR